MVVPLPQRADKEYKEKSRPVRFPEGRLRDLTVSRHGEEPAPQSRQASHAQENHVTPSPVLAMTLLPSK